MISGDMRKPSFRHCLNIELLRYVRDNAPPVEELREWLGPAREGCYFLLQKAGLLQVRDDKVYLSPEHCSADGERFWFESREWVLNEDTVIYYNSEKVNG